MSTTFYMPDPFIAWLFKQSMRILAACVAIGIIAFVASIVFRTIALLVDSLHAALHSVHVICLSVNQVYLESGLVGQFLMCLILLSILLLIIVRWGHSLYQSWRANK